ncbi:hypothetical protein PsYK624_056030 [Phanerochaete sordida]|uniref:Uncharacterized protein n=1 Tax=Phanerochaete sordida TaxID=48140 RepID=A0A9P3LD36_9APHY|nr:hypothetical protein PsYK624_056030 [Phanerochaete sordida]
MPFAVRPRRRRIPMPCCGSLVSAYKHLALRCVHPHGSAHLVPCLPGVVSARARATSPAVHIPQPFAASAARAHTPSVLHQPRTTRGDRQTRSNTETPSVALSRANRSLDVTALCARPPHSQAACKRRSLMTRVGEHWLASLVEWSGRRSSCRYAYNDIFEPSRF